MPVQGVRNAIAILFELEWRVSAKRGLGAQPSM